MEARASFPAELASAAGARHFTEATLVAWGLASVREAARLLVSELVVNGVLHACTPVSLSLGLDGSCLRVEVTDGSDEVPVRREHPPSAPTGRGMMIVDALADRWGVEVADGTKTVWFELEAAEPTAPHRATRGAIVEGTP